MYFIYVLMLDFHSTLLHLSILGGKLFNISSLSGSARFIFSSKYRRWKTEYLVADENYGQMVAQIYAPCSGTKTDIGKSKISLLMQHSRCLPSPSPSPTVLYTSCSQKGLDEALK